MVKGKNRRKNANEDKTKEQFLGEKKKKKKKKSSKKGCRNASRLTIVVAATAAIVAVGVVATSVRVATTVVVVMVVVVVAATTATAAATTTAGVASAIAIRAVRRLVGVDAERLRVDLALLGPVLSAAELKKKESKEGRGRGGS